MINKQRFYETADVMKIYYVDKNALIKQKGNKRILKKYI